MLRKLIFCFSLFTAFCNFASGNEWTPDPDCPFPDGDETVYYPYPGDCSKYIECWDGEKTIKECPPGTWWHPAIENCDYPGSYCTDSPVTTSSSKPPISTTRDPDWTPDPDCPFPSNEINFYPYPGDCSKYIECWDGEKTIHDCPGGLWWHPVDETCDYPGSYCSDTPVSSSSTEKPTSPGPDPRCEDNATTYWAHPVYCHLYIECYAGNSYEMRCPIDLYFSQSQQKCVDAKLSECCSTSSCSENKKPVVL